MTKWVEPVTCGDEYTGLAVAFQNILATVPGIGEGPANNSEGGA